WGSATFYFLWCSRGIFSAGHGLYAFYHCPYDGKLFRAVSFIEGFYLRGETREQDTLFYQSPAGTGLYFLGPFPHQERKYRLPVPAVGQAKGIAPAEPPD